MQIDGIRTVGQETILGQPWWVYSNGRRLPVIRGGAGEETETEETEEGEETEEEGPKFNAEQQRHLNRIMTREKREGKAAGVNSLLKELGFDDPSKADRKAIKAMLDKAKKDEADALSDTEKARREAEEARNTATQTATEVKLEKVHAKAERFLVRAGLSVDQDDDVKAERQINRAIKLLDIDSDSDAATVREAVEDLREEMPSMFKTDEESDDDQEPNSKAGDRKKKPPTKKSGDPGKAPGRKASGTPHDRALALLDQRYPDRSKKKD